MWIDDLIAENEELKFGRVVDDNGSVGPSRDTGFRTEPRPPHVYIAPPPVSRYVAYDDQLHESEITVTGTPIPIPSQTGKGFIFGGNESTALNAVNFVKANYPAAVERNLGYIRNNIKNRQAYEKSLLTSLV